ncbi:hypothetical protein BESB_022450 [Besnoitia besnoiti]|uniref:Glycosyltransferase family 17 protein n=1 Tax=Besnoitia besnoiti TaxID=94643 RepID=A0A2A9M7V3_BESBE|nr:hypothetical protein BESB_022450 [Besnoitia besnoiti]PFH31753.1 hypothetical protein BESB_022450 [Besnoitia besnoiti]
MKLRQHGDGGPRAGCGCVSHDDESAEGFQRSSQDQLEMARRRRSSGAGDSGNPPISASGLYAPVGDAGGPSDGKHAQRKGQTADPVAACSRGLVRCLGGLCSPPRPLTVFLCLLPLAALSSVLLLLVCRSARKGVNVFDLKSAFFGNSYGCFIRDAQDAESARAENFSLSLFPFLSELADRLVPSDDLDPLLQPRADRQSRALSLRQLPAAAGDAASARGAMTGAFEGAGGNRLFCFDAALDPVGAQQGQAAVTTAKRANAAGASEQDVGRAQNAGGVAAAAVAVANGPCLPSFEAAIRLYDWRLKNSWAARRWRYHAPEYVRKAFTLFLPIDRRLHELYRREMAAILAIVGPYVEIEPPVPIAADCYPPEAYTVVPRRASAEGGGGPKRASNADGAQEKPAAAAFHAPFTGEAASFNASSRHAEDEKLHTSQVTLDAYCEEARRVHRGAFTGKGREKAVKIVDTVILGYDLDLLEVRLYELEHTVDYFVILESRHHTTGLFEKPLLFKQNRHRFARFLHKVIYFEIPPAISQSYADFCAKRFLQDYDNCWRFEFSSRDILLWMLARLNEGIDAAGNTHLSAPLFGTDDLIMTGDPDEIIRGDRLRHLKFCEPVEQPTLGWAMVHYPGRIDAMAQKEFGAQTGLATDVPYAIGPLMDTFRYQAIQYLVRVPDPRVLGHVFRRHALSQLQPPLYLYGGWHMSDLSYLPYLMSKIPVDDNKPGYEPWSVYRHLVNGELDLAQREVWEKFRDYRQVGASVVEASQVPEAYRDIGFGDVPWVMKCNPMRYPTWFRMLDKRYFMHPNKSFYRGAEPLFAQDVRQWLEIVNGIRDKYKPPVS